MSRNLEQRFTESFNDFKYLPVEPYAEDSKVFEAGDEQLLVCPPITEFLTGAVKYWDLAHSAPVPDKENPLCERDSDKAMKAPVVKSLGSGVAAPEPRALGQDLLQLLGGAASDQGPDQGQGVGIEVGLEKKLKLVALF